MADIDSLTIRISAQTGRAVDNINNLITALGNLNTALNSINPNALNGIANAAQSLGNTVAPLRACGQTLNTVTSNLQSMGQQSANVAQVGNAAQGLAQTAQQAAQATQAATNAASQGTAQTQNLGNALNNVSNNATNAARSLRETGSSSRASSRQFKGMFKELTRISKMLKLMVTRMVLRKVIQGVLDGFKNLAQYSSTFDASLSLLWNSFRQLGNSIAAAVSPLLNALAPAINYIIQLFIKAVNVINQFISALTGLGTWTRAKTLTDDYAKSLDKSNKSAKALKKTVLGFDELNQLHDNNSGGGGGTSPKDMFEQVPIDPRILKFIDDLKKKIGELKKYWDAFKKGFARGLGDDWKDKVGLILDGVSRIRQAAKDIWNDPEVSKARERYFLSLSEMLGTVAGTITRVGLNIGANLAQGIAGSLEEKSPRIKKYLVDMFDIGTDVNNQISEFSLAIGKISDVLVGENAIAATQGFSNLFLESFMLISENAAKLGSSIVTFVTQPIIDNTDKISQALDGLMGILASLADFLQTVVGGLRDSLSEAWEAHLSPMFESLTSALSDLVGVIMDAWNKDIQPVLQEAADTLKPLWEQYIQPIVNDIIQIVATGANMIGKWIKLLVSIATWAIGNLVDLWFPRLRDALSIIISWVKLLFQVASTVIQNTTWIFRTFIQFVETVFTKGWSDACKELSESWSKHWDEMLEKLKGIANSVVEIVEKMINAIVNAVNDIGGAVGDKLKNVSFPSWLGGGTFSLSIPKLAKVSLPRFAGGGFPRENGLFMANSSELVGKFSNGRTAVANNAQITQGIAQAVFNAISSANSMNGGSERYINNTIYIGEEEVARAVTRGQEKIGRRHSPTMA